MRLAWSGPGCLALVLCLSVSRNVNSHQRESESKVHTDLFLHGSISLRHQSPSCCTAVMFADHENPKIGYFVSRPKSYVDSLYLAIWYLQTDLRDMDKPRGPQKPVRLNPGVDVMCR